MNAQLDVNPIFETESDVYSAYFGSTNWMKAPNGKRTNLTESQWLQVRTAPFKQWFGDWEFNSTQASKILDDNGEPMVVYHGSNKLFEAFDPYTLSNNTGNDGHYGSGFYFSIEQMEAETYGNTLYPVFINIPSPVYNSANSLESIAKAFGIEKEFQNVDKQWLANQIAAKDANAGKLAQLFAQGMSYEDAWDEFLASGGNVHSSEIDLNSVGDVFDNMNGCLSAYDLEFITTQLSEIPEHVKVYGYDYEPNIIHLTDMGNCGQAFTAIAKEHNFDGVWAGSEIVAFNPNQIKSAITNNGQFSSDNQNIYS